MWRSEFCVCLCVSAGPAVKPSVSLLPPSSLQISGDSAALLCLLSSYSPQGAQVSWTLDGSEVTEGVQTSAESERDGRYSRSSVLSLSKARWEDAERFVCRVHMTSCSRDLVPQELRVLMFLQWRAAGFTAVTWFTAQYSSSLSICCHCCSFNKASERLTFVFDCIIDQCVLPSLKFQLLLMDCNSWEQLRLAVNVNWSSWGLNMVSGDGAALFWDDQNH